MHAPIHVATDLTDSVPGACVFVDPVNFLIFLPNTSQVLQPGSVWHPLFLLSPFGMSTLRMDGWMDQCMLRQVLIHKRPSTLLTWAAQKLVAHELCTAITLCRRTWWWEVAYHHHDTARDALCAMSLESLGWLPYEHDACKVMLWPEEVECPTVVVLGAFATSVSSASAFNRIGVPLVSYECMIEECGAGQYDALLPATACANWIRSCDNENIRVEMVQGSPFESDPSLLIHVLYTC